MPEIGPTDAHLAFLYASGEMDAGDRADFERRLGEEQALREALCQAVELLRTLEGLTPPRPQPAYRQRVRQRLLRLRSYRGHPLLWSALGAAAALLVMLIVPSSWLPSRSAATPPPDAPVVAVEPPKPTPDPAADEADDEPATIEMAEMWASMHNHDHLARAQEEENRRRDRRLAHGEHALHPSTPPSVRH